MKTCLRKTWIASGRNKGSAEPLLWPTKGWTAPTTLISCAARETATFFSETERHEWEALPQGAFSPEEWHASPDGSYKWKLTEKEYRGNDIRFEIQDGERVEKRLLSPENGLDKALSGDYNIVLMDLMLPLKTGEEVLKKLRSVKSTPVIIISARLEVYNRIEPVCGSIV